MNVCTHVHLGFHHAPDSHVVTPGYDGLAVKAEGHTVNAASVTFKGSDALPCGRAPQPIGSGGGDSGWNTLQQEDC